MKKFICDIIIVLIVSFFLLVAHDEIFGKMSYPKRVLNENGNFFTFKPGTQGTYNNSRENISWSVNNEGWIDSNIFPKKNSRLNLIMGDSYIQSLEVDAGSYFSSLFERNGHHVNQIGMAGSSFAQYLFWIEYYSSSYKLDSMFLSLNSQDFKEATRSDRNINHLVQFDDSNKLLVPNNETDLSVKRLNFLKRVYIAFPSIRKFKNIFIGLDKVDRSFQIDIGKSRKQLELVSVSLRKAKYFLVIYDELGDTGYTSLIREIFPRAIIFNSFSNEQNLIGPSNRHWNELYREEIIEKIDQRIRYEKAECD